MSDRTVGLPDNPVRVEVLHEAHPKIRAVDWRSPFVARMIDEADYVDGTVTLATSFRSPTATTRASVVHISWSGLQRDYEQCINTYQAPDLTEYAALAVACILCSLRAGLEITEVTRRGEKVDYWLGDRTLLLEVSGTKAGDLESLCRIKASKQLMTNPFHVDGYVCVASFARPEARLWFYAFGDESE